MYWGGGGVRFGVFLLEMREYMMGSYLYLKFVFEKRNNLDGEGHFSINFTSLEKIPGYI